MPMANVPQLGNLLEGHVDQRRFVDVVPQELSQRGAKGKRATADNEQEALLRQPGEMPLPYLEPECLGEAFLILTDALGVVYNRPIR